MIYYYFGSKEQLYCECLIKLYGDIRKTEQSLDLESLPAEQAIRRLVEFTFDHHDRNVDFVRIICTENIHYGEYVKQSPAIREMSSLVLEALGNTLRRGVQEGVFRTGIEVIDLHMLMSSFCFYRVSNRHTFGEIFQIDLSDEQVKLRHKAMICDAVLRYIQTEHRPENSPVAGPAPLPASQPTGARTGLPAMDCVAAPAISSIPARSAHGPTAFPSRAVRSPHLHP